jgi:AcrR family transcriptional regulator
MVRSGGDTRDNIIRQAAALFNQHGYAGSSLADIMAATGLQKGGIYRHFESKEQLALEALDYALEVMGARFAAAVQGRPHALDRLHAIVGVFAASATDPPVPGGCPVMNAGIENDDGNPALRERARSAMDGLRALVRRVVERGRERGEVRDGVDGDALASLLISTLEGAVMMTRLYDDPLHIRRATDFMDAYLEDNVRAA